MDVSKVSRCFMSRETRFILEGKKWVMLEADEERSSCVSLLETHPITSSQLSQLCAPLLWKWIQGCTYQSWHLTASWHTAADILLTPKTAAVLLTPAHHGPEQNTEKPNRFSHWLQVPTPSNKVPSLLTLKSWGSDCLSPPSEEAAFATYLDEWEIWNSIVTQTRNM